MRKYLILTIFLLQIVLASPNNGKVLNVPYVNQKYDSPDWFDGRYSCGPTSVVMVLAYYGVLTPWPANKTEPFPHVTLYGNYIACKFKVGSFIFDEKQVDASRTMYGYGVHGYVYEPGVGAVWDKMVEVFKIFGFEAYVDTTPTWEELVKEIDEGRPVILSTQMTSSGHIIVAVGYTPDKSVIVNDPAGDKSLGYFNYKGEKVVYDWPGVNNGHVNLVKVKAFIIVHPTKNLKKAIPITPCKGEKAYETEKALWMTLILIIGLLLLAILGKVWKLKTTN